MLRKRVIVCLDVKDGRVVKGVNFQDVRDVGDPVELAARYEREGADEVVFLDISASAEERRTLLDVARRAAERLFVPLTVGGGIKSVGDIARALRAGADKVSVNSAAVQRPELLSEAAERFGRQCVVASIDAKKEGAMYRVHTHGGRTPTDLDAIAWAEECAARGAGEILLTSIDRDGRRSGHALDLTRRVAERVSVPVVASGGAGRAEHFRNVFEDTGVDAALAAGMFHDGSVSIGRVKRTLADAGLPIREPEESTP